MPEFGVLYCLLDEAYALGQPSAELTLTTLVRDTGLARTSVSRALQGLEAKGLIVKERHNTPEHGWEATTYRVEITDDARYVNRRPSSATLLASSDSGPAMARNATRRHDPSLPIDKKKKRSTPQGKYFSGDYALCPRCHERPCTCER
jgi:DNA-binding transcriptional MocR family regulator